MNSLLQAVQARSTRMLAESLHTPSSARDLENALFCACQEGLVDCVKYLLQEGAADPNVRNASGNTPLYLAVKEGHHDVAAALCDAGANVDARVGNSNTALHLAARWGKDDCLQILLERGCSINVLDSTSSTALILAVRGKHYVAIGNLIQSGCRLDNRDDQGRTALHYACHTAVAVDQLLRAGANVNIRDNQGCTPLLMAAAEGLCVKDLIAAGADVNLLDSESKSPLWYAVANGRRDVTALLLRANGQVHTYQCPVDHPEQACPVRIAIEKSQIEILKLFILSGYDNKHIRECLEGPAMHDLFSGSQVSHWLLHAKEVLSLRQICRKWLRHHLDFRLFMDLSKLPVPDKLKNYLSLEELEDALTES